MRTMKSAEHARAVGLMAAAALCWSLGGLLIKSVAWPPLARATRLPANPANCRSSQKNRAMPLNTTTMVHQSARVARSPRNHAPKSAIHTGAVYWRRMALAAVVSLLAVTNRMVVPA